MKTIFPTPPIPRRHAVAKLADLPPGSSREFVVAGRKLAVFNSEGRIFAIDNVCTHEGGPLAEGAAVTRPRHDAEFDAVSGTALCPPANADIQSYPVFVNADKIEVEV
jgi:3-phenylpropionate/trans-cinnamate dioxygenase ferredoxin subunit